MKKNQIEIIGLVVALVVLVVIATLVLKPAAPTSRTGGGSKPKKVAKATGAKSSNVPWVLSQQVEAAIPNVDGGRDPFKDLMLPVSDVGRPLPPLRPNSLRNPPPGRIIPDPIDTGGPLVGPGDVKPVELPEPPAIVVKGIVFSGDTRFVALIADEKPYTLYRGERIPGTDWSVTEIAPTEITVKNGIQTARFRLSGGR